MKRKVLVFGAGVIGAYLTHVLIEAGNEVTVLAREERAGMLCLKWSRSICFTKE